VVALEGYLLPHFWKENIKIVPYGYIISGNFTSSVLCNSCSFGQSDAGPLNLACGGGSFGKIWSACGPHEIKYTEWRINEKKI